MIEPNSKLQKQIRLHAKLLRFFQEQMAKNRQATIPKVKKKNKRMKEGVGVCGVSALLDMIIQLNKKSQI